jgi:hypothetical protein
MSNTLDQHFNAPDVQLYVGYQHGSTDYTPASSVGVANCAALALSEQNQGINTAGLCQGQYGYLYIYDQGSAGKATSFNHSLFAQDAWTIGHGITINAGLRLDKEYLPGEASGTGVPAHPIDFSWADKIAPRIGAAWDIFQNGKLKVFGSYGEFYDIMKLNLATSSFGGQYWQNCYYGLNTSDLSSIAPVFNSANRYCVGPSAGSTANFAGNTQPAGLFFLANQNFRTFPTTCSTCNQFQEGVAPGLKPYAQHDSVFGFDYAINPSLALEVRWDRRRLDHVIEDSSIFDVTNASETFVIVNPGQGVNRTFNGFCTFLYGSSATASGGACTSPTGSSAVPPANTIPAARSYDGLEIRLTKAAIHNWYGLLSYTYSHFRGNYTGLTSSDLADGGLGGRNAPNNSRSFDEPYFSWNANGGSSSGLLPTDRPNVLKGDAYYELKYLKKFNTDFGLFQTVYQGSPNTTYMDVGLGGSGWPVDLYNRGKWVDITQDPQTGAITIGKVRTYRNPMYVQSDFNLEQGYKISESKSLKFSATFTNLFNQHAVTAVNEQIDTGYGYQFAMPGGQYLLNGLDFYSAAMSKYSVADVLSSSNSQGGPITVNSQYGKPMCYQLARTIRLGFKLTF